MSAVGKKYNNKHMNLSAKCWLSHQRNLIRLVKKYPITYLASPKNTTNLHKIRLDFVWEEIASKLGQPTRKCKLQWTKVKLKYAKIMILINTGKITKEDAISHPETYQFFDGLLSFLDPYICDITDEDIPVFIHKSINNLFGLKTKCVKGSHIEGNCHFVTHAQVKCLLTERRLRGDAVDSTQMEYLQGIVDIAVQRKLGELIRNASSNSSNDIDNIDDDDTVNVTMMPNTSVKVVCKRKATSNLNQSESILNKDDENRTRSINLGLESELMIEDDIKIEKEDDINIEKEDDIKIEKEDDIKREEEDYVNRHDEVYENIHDEDIVKEENFTVVKNINNTTVRNFDQENSLPRSPIIEPVVHDMEKNTLRGLNENAIIIEDNTEDMTDNTPPITDEYLRNFFGELGVIMSMELSLDRQKILKSRINALLKNNLLKEG